jgi:hypothetical protein
MPQTRMAGLTFAASDTGSLWKKTSPEPCTNLAERRVSSYELVSGRSGKSLAENLQVG